MIYRGESIVRFFVTMAAVLAVAVLAGCAATRQEVSDKLGSRFLGKSVDTLVSEFGPPTSAFKMNSGETAYVWQLSAVTNINTSEGSGTAKTNYCKVSVISSPNGLVTKLTTEDSSGTGGILGLAGVDIHGSICARHLGM